MFTGSACATRAAMSTHERPRPDEPAPDLVANLRLEVREAYRPGRWMWELIDARDGTPFERQFEFDSASDARQSGLARLAELTPSLPGAKMIATTDDAARRRTGPASRSENSPKALPN